jgi:hypothetical protein
MKFKKLFMRPLKIRNIFDLYILWETTRAKKKQQAMKWEPTGKYDVFTEMLLQINIIISERNLYMHIDMRDMTSGHMMESASSR